LLKGSVLGTCIAAIADEFQRQLAAILVSTPAPYLHAAIPSLETLCTRAVVGWSTSYGIPSCSSLTPLAAQRLLGALMEAKRLHPKIFAAFYGW